MIELVRLFKLIGFMNILLVIVDTLRYDALGVNGKSKSTPHLDKFAHGKSFTKCFSAAPWTLPSCASILTGFYPSNHHLMQHWFRLDKEPISSILQRQGFYTAAITNNSN